MIPTPPFPAHPTRLHLWCEHAPSLCCRVGVFLFGSREVFFADISIWFTRRPHARRASVARRFFCTSILSPCSTGPAVPRCGYHPVPPSKLRFLQQVEVA